MAADVQRARRRAAAPAAAQVRGKQRPAAEPEAESTPDAVRRAAGEPEAERIRRIARTIRDLHGRPRSTGPSADDLDQATLLRRLLRGTADGRPPDRL